MRSIKKPIGLTPTERRLDCYAYACNLNKPQDYIGQIAGYEDKDVFSKEEVIERLIADMTEEDIYVREASYEETPSDWEWRTHRTLDGIVNGCRSSLPSPCSST